MMASTFKLFNTVSLQSNINANLTFNSSSDDRYCIIAEDGFYVLHLCGLMHTISSNLSLKKFFVTIPEYSPSANLGIDLSSFVGDLFQNELYEAILDLDISEKVRDATLIKQQPVQVKWSPIGLISNNHCAIASLTNRGSLNIFVFTVNEVEVEEYVSIGNITKCYIEHLKSSWSEVTDDDPSMKLVELKRRVAEALPTACEWSNIFKINGMEFCLLFVSHLGGNLTIWRIDCRKMNQINGSGIKLISTHKTDMKRITALAWQQVNNDGILLLGNIEGNISLLMVTNITEESLSFGNNMCLWNEFDHIQVEQFKFFIRNGMTYVCVIKGSFLIIYLISEMGEILDIHNFHAGNINITGVEHLEDDKYLVLTHIGVIKEIKLMVVDHKIQIEWRHFYLDFPWHLYRTHGLVVSTNKVFVAILTSMAKINDMRRKKSHIQLLIFKNMSKSPINILMKNCVESIASFWDCFEILRLGGVIDKKLPTEGLPPQLDYDKLSICQIKTCYWLTKSVETLYDKMYFLDGYTQLRTEDLKHILKIKLACKHMHRLFEIIADGKEIGEFHMQSLDVINMYLKEVVLDGLVQSLGLGKNTIADLYNAISTANELQYPEAVKCVLCSEDIIGTSCVPLHMDTRCSISFMQVLDLPYYKCPFCSAVVHHRLTEIYHVIVCPYCDVTMHLVSVLDDNAVSRRETTLCSTDCLKEVIDVINIEEHAFTNFRELGDHVDLLVVSSSDEEAESNQDVTEIESPNDENAPQIECVKLDSITGN